MNGNDIDRTLAEWFEADAMAPAPADGVDRALEAALRRTPRRAWLAAPGSHWGWESSSGGVGIRWSTALAVAVVLAALIGVAMLAGARLVAPPAPPARLGHLAYALDGDIFVADGDGGNAVRVADGKPGTPAGCGSAGYRAEGPMWSPDGRLFAYRSPMTTEACPQTPADTVYLSDPAGQVVASVPGVGWTVAWSPDSTRVATWLDLYPMTMIGVYGIDGERQAVLRLPPSISSQIPGDFEPVWSADGESLLVPTHDANETTCSLDRRICGPKWVIWEIPVDGRPPRTIPDADPRSNWGSTRSPNGRHVASFVEDVDGSGGPGTLVVANADGSAPRELFAAGAEQHWLPDYRPVWSPSGDRIAFVATGAPGVNGDGRQSPGGASRDLRLFDVASGSVTTVATGGGDGLSAIGFSPAGDRVLFKRFGADGESRSLWSVSVDGSAPLQLVSGTIDGDWQPLQPGPGPTP